MIEFENNSASSIVVCIDTFNPSEEALRYSCIKAVKNNLKLHILVVIDVAEKNLIFGAKVIENQKREKIENKIRDLIDKVCFEFKITPVISIREGNIAIEIIKELKLNNIAMVVFGKSQNSQSDEIVLPKIINTIGNKIKIPVIIIPENVDKIFLELNL
jgi:K+-sensing histidine kinase KdpD